MTLMSMPDGISLAEWERVLTAIDECHAPGTRAVYASHWKKWQLWCSAHGVPDLPAFAEDLAAYLAEQATSQAMNTVRTAISQAGIPGSTPPDGPGWAASRMASRAKAVTVTPSASRATSRKNAPQLGAVRTGHSVPNLPLTLSPASGGLRGGVRPALENP